MINFFKNLFSKQKEVVPEVQVKALPIEQNPGPALKLQRTAGRIANIMDAIAQGDSRQELKKSLAIYQARLVALGHDVPESAEEARKIMRGDV